MILGCYELLFDFGHFRIRSYVKFPYFSPEDCDTRGQNEKLTAKRIFDFLIIENFKLISFGRVFLVTQWSKLL